MNIIAQLQGGLGNQLFQYATAKALANRLGGNLQLDTVWFRTSYKDVTKREMQLLELKIDAELICLTPMIQRPKRIQRIAQSLLPINPYIYSENKPYQFDSRLNGFQAKNNQSLYLLGYWQSYKYFSKIRELLISEIYPRSELHDTYQTFLKSIKEKVSGMVHVRRGDYVNLQAAAKVHGFLGVEYYRSGMTKLLNKNPEIQFFVFSDDIQWTKKHLPFQDRITYIEAKSGSTSTTQELFLMTQCDYHLIANSSLSWWGAWLAHQDSAKGKVIAPIHWTNDHQVDWNDLLPSSWERI